MTIRANNPILLFLFPLALLFTSPLFARGDTFIVIPQYPELSRLARIEGTVMVDVAFDKHGNVSSVSMNANKPNIPMLVPCVLGAISKWHIRKYANAKQAFTFTFSLLPEAVPDGEVVSYVDLEFGQINILARKQRPMPVGE